MPYSKQDWHNAPNTTTPISEDRLGHMEDGIFTAQDTVEQLAASLPGDYAPALQGVSSYTYNPDGSVATATESGVTTTYAYNDDGTVHTATRNGVTRTYSYNPDGTVSGVA